MRKSTVLLLTAIWAVSACGAGEVQPSPETTTTTLGTAGLEAWRSCLIDRVGQSRESTENQLAALDKDINEASQQIKAASEEISRLTSIISAMEDIYDDGTELLNETGLPATIEQVRAEDPEIAAALDEGTVEAFETLSLEQLQTLGAVMERENDHAFKMAELRSDKTLAIESNQEAQVLKRRLESDRAELLSEQEAVIAELETALSAPSDELDWSLCTGGG